MSETKYVVPDGMMKAAYNEFFKAASLNGRPSVTDGERLLYALEAALRWLSENPIVPTSEQLYSTIGKLPVAMCDIVWTERDRAMIAEWQRCMFLAPEPKVPEEIKDLLSNPEQFDKHPFQSNKVSLRKDIIEKIAIEAFRRGKAAKETE